MMTMPDRQQMDRQRNDSRQNDRQQKDLVRDRFTFTAEVFGDYAVAERAREAELLAKLLGLRGDERAIDLACGPGTLALRFARHVRWICGLDLTPAILKRARASAAAEKLHNLDFAIGDAQALPFANGSLDVAVTSYSLHHMSDAARVIGEMARVVRQGGRVGVIDIRVLEDTAAAELNNRIERLRDPSHTRTLARSEFDKIFASHGLRVRKSQIEEHPRPFNHWMHVAGWKPSDAAYIETRRLLEATIENDVAGFHPRLIPDGKGAELHLVNTVLFTAAEKT
jgi:ubiquinone/menaquinone biosynthesis C-methylase UbiE